MHSMWMYHGSSMDFDWLVEQMKGDGLCFDWHGSGEGHSGYSFCRWDCPLTTHVTITIRWGSHACYSGVHLIPETDPLLNDFIKSVWASSLYHLLSYASTDSECVSQQGYGSGRARTLVTCLLMREEGDAALTGMPSLIYKIPALHLTSFGVVIGLQLSGATQHVTFGLCASGGTAEPSKHLPANTGWVPEPFYRRGKVCCSTWHGMAGRYFLPWEWIAQIKSFTFQIKNSSNTAVLHVRYWYWNLWCMSKEYFKFGFFGWVWDEN
jgi:hypothetical protein